MNYIWHFPVMILVSFLFFCVVIGIVLGKKKFYEKKQTIIYLATFVVIGGMLIGKYGANWGLPWWIYYPIPMLMNVFAASNNTKNETSRNTFILVFELNFSSCYSLVVFFPFWLDRVYAFLESYLRNEILICQINGIWKNYLLFAQIINLDLL